MAPSPVIFEKSWVTGCASVPAASCAVVNVVPSPSLSVPAMPLSSVEFSVSVPAPFQVMVLPEETDRLPTFSAAPSEVVNV